MIVRKTATLAEIKGKEAVLALDNGHELIVGREELGVTDIGAAFVVEVMPESLAKEALEERSRTVLNQLLDEE